MDYHVTAEANIFLGVRKEEEYSLIILGLATIILDTRIPEKVGTYC